ncbi:UDP-glucose 4-epimerase GalE [Salibaculum griseiflavum]|uniref:UDP-glucose 4-epimerase n=1 Tax=Salibaculum griseiflavum TaxID=1914409 RepID=A0A2V1P0T8_9RHOB|nr:UDP-glucose 4-epimerase GalE [Salibaculum griseiflavum]PWG16161.1 UDP-glucose 4-epimerase GalE [Salibaculum griseiflavum]
MKILVTGGAGYIGSHTLVVLLAAGHDVVVLDNFSNGSREALRRVQQLSNRDFNVVEGDVRDRSILDRLFADHEPAAVVHFAGLKAVGESVEDPLSYYDVNVGGSMRLLEAMSKASCKRIVFSSSATVYGTPEYLPYDEDHPTRPVNPYGRTKLAVEELLGDWCAASPSRCAISLRYFNPVGAHPSGRIGEDPKGIPNNLMPYIAQTAVGRRERLQIFGDDYDTRDGTGERDYIHVIDLAEAHVAALERLENMSAHTALNIGTGSGMTVKELIGCFENILGRKLPTSIAPRREGDLPSFYANPSRANEALDWKARRSPEDMCRDSWTWQSRNPEGFGPTAID